MMKVYELDIPTKCGLTNFDLISYIDQLKVPYFRGVFMRDELPNRKHIIECGIMNLNTSDQIGSHWLCFVRNKKDRIYFDSFGQNTKFVKTELRLLKNIFEPLLHHPWLNAVKFVGGIRREGPKLSMLGTYDLPNR